MCHRAIVACQREIEAKGIPTVLVTVAPKDSKAMRPPRAVHPVGHMIGATMGGPGERELQLRVLQEALRQFETLHTPGEIVDLNL